MRIAQVASVLAPVRRAAPASVECLVWNLSYELTRMGHEVTTFGVEGSEPCGRFVATLPGPVGSPGSFDEWHLAEWINLCRAFEHASKFDIIHTHAYLWGIPPARLSATPAVHTLHISPEPEHVLLRRCFPDAIVSAISDFQWSPWPELAPYGVVHNGILVDDFPFGEKSGSHLCYLGRFIPSKGAVSAIKAAKKTGRRLVLAGPRNEYFTKQVEPLIDGDKVQYRGAVKGEARSELLQNASCLIYPLTHPEPFGLVLIEAMMCGTPVAATAKGAVLEIVEEGWTGSTTETMEGLPECIERACSLDRAAVRRRVEQRFSSRQMAEGYERLYERAIAERKL